MSLLASSPVKMSVCANCLVEAAIRVLENGLGVVNGLLCRFLMGRNKFMGCLNNKETYVWFLEMFQGWNWNWIEDTLRYR
jgi:hypothetical protein